MVANPAVNHLPPFLPAFAVYEKETHLRRVRLYVETIIRSIA